MEQKYMAIDGEGTGMCPPASVITRCNVWVGCLSSNTPASTPRTAMTSTKPANLRWDVWNA